MPDSSTVLRYIKVRNLYRQVKGGEREAAKAAMNRIEAEHPGVEAEANRFEAQSVDGGNAASPAPQSSNGFGWSDLQRAAADAFRTAQTFAQKVAASEVGVQLADEVDADVKVTRQGNVHVVFKMDLDTLASMRELNAIQREAFIQALHEVLEVQLTELFEALNR